MKQARKITISDGIVYEVGQQLSPDVVVERIEVGYPMAQVYTNKSSTKAALDVFLNPWSIIEYIET